MDIYGQALSDFYENGTTDTVWIHNSYDEPEEMPIDIFFRSADEMPELELLALEHCNGKVLDVGAGVGSHALILQQQKKDVTAVDISPLAVNIMKKRGVKNALEADFFKLKGKYDTLLFLMNGIGLSGTLQGFINCLAHARTLLNPGGQLLFDSSDISYLYQNLPKPTNKYFGEVSYQYVYKNQKGPWFDWIYLDQKTLVDIAAQQGWITEILFDDGEDQFLARLTLATG